MAIIGENSLVAISNPNLEEYGLFYENLIMELAQCESSNDPTVINKNDCGSPSYGLLQYKAQTFYSFCVVKYGLPNDIMNPDVQKKCANEMILEKWDNIYNWANCYYKLNKK